MTGGWSGARIRLLNDVAMQVSNARLQCCNFLPPFYSTLPAFIFFQEETSWLICKARKTALQPLSEIYRSLFLKLLCLRVDLIKITNALNYSLFLPQIFVEICVFKDIRQNSLERACFL